LTRLIDSIRSSTSTSRSRRDFLRLSGLSLAVPAASALLAACNQTVTAPVGGSAAAPAADQHGKAPAQEGTIDWKQMDEIHEAGVKAFPAKTTGVANELLSYTMDGDVKVFKLTTQVIQWQVTPTMTVEAWTYNGSMPGPQIRVTEGDKVRIVLTNNLPESTS